MKSIHRPGNNYGVDCGIVAIVLLWIAITIVLVILLALRNGDGAPIAVPHQQDVKAMPEGCQSDCTERETRCQLRL